MPHPNEFPIEALEPATPDFLVAADLFAQYPELSPLVIDVFDTDISVDERISWLELVPNVAKKRLEKAKSELTSDPISDWNPDLPKTITIYNQEEPSNIYKNMAIMAGSVAGGLALFKFGIEPMIEDMDKTYVGLKNLFGSH